MNTEEHRAQLLADLDRLTAEYDSAKDPGLADALARTRRELETLKQQVIAGELGGRLRGKV